MNGDFNGNDQDDMRKNKLYVDNKTQRKFLKWFGVKIFPLRPLL